MTSRGAVSAKGFSQTKFGYEVAAQKDGIVGAEWQLDNFVYDQSELVPKKSDLYVTNYHLDLDGDGDGDADSHPRELLYDLRYTHRERSSVVWLRTFPISASLKTKALRVLLNDYVEEISGAGYEAVLLSRNHLVVLEKRFAANVLEETPAQVAGREAYVATLEVANVDQLSLAPKSRTKKVRIALIRTPFTYEHLGTEFPVLMLAGFASLPDDFAKDLPVYERFLGEIVVGGKRGVEFRGLPKAPSRDKPIESAEQPNAGPFLRVGHSG